MAMYLSSGALRLHAGRFLFWDEDEQVLWLDLRKVFPAVGVIKVPSWDWMLLHQEGIPEYPPELDLLNWSLHSDLRFWLKPIPKWVVESCQLFPTHQLKLLHLAGRYPAMLELLDHSPMLAWHLVKLDLTEMQLQDLFQAKRVRMVERLGWPGKEDTLIFLRNLRLRKVNSQLLEQVEVCLLDEQRLAALTALPRINSMALSLAARFPQLIGKRLHQTLARLPCRPMQCQSMVALLEDVYCLAYFLNEPDVTEQIGACRYLIDVEQRYQAWLVGACPAGHHSIALFAIPKRLVALAEWSSLSLLQQQAWWIDYSEKPSDFELWAWYYEGEAVGALIKRSQTGRCSLLRCRQGQNQLPSAALQAQVELWLVQA